MKMKFRFTFNGPTNSSIPVRIQPANIVGADSGSPDIAIFIYHWFKTWPSCKVEPVWVQVPSDGWYGHFHIHPIAQPVASVRLPNLRLSRVTEIKKNAALLLVHPITAPAVGWPRFHPPAIAQASACAINWTSIILCSGMSKHSLFPEQSTGNR